MSTLVIVESPTKARTIRNFLPSAYRVEASMGHVRDLPQSAAEIPAAYKSEEWARLGVNVAGNFEPLYVVPADKKKKVKELQELLKGATELILATDEDREGESISWHLLQLLKPKVPTKRMVFHEITAEAIKQSLANCRQVDERLVRAQETRRILDRLVGYTLSPLLWKKVGGGLSAGRVQSVAVRLIVQREKERRAFRSATFWDVKATLYAPKLEFPTQLISLQTKKIATGDDFDDRTGQLIGGKNVVLLDEAAAQALVERLQNKPWTVTQKEERPTTRKPSPPFTTSTLQQEANRKFRFGAKDTMRTAQALYEQGYITYMRTDSVHLSQQAIDAARSCVSRMYGDEYLSPKPRQYATKAKNAQEAHEAIRPAGEQFRTPQETGLSGRELQLYDLIWKRTVACQMADARQTMTSVLIGVDDAVFRSAGKRIDFPGFFRAYVEGSDDPEAAIEGQEVLLPLLQEGDHPQCRQLQPLKHETQPPARYTEASLVKTLESEGIGRPSTYASIIDKICSERGYVQMQHNALVPTFTAFAVTNLLEANFPNLVDTAFTSKMEQTLDDISTGSIDWLPYLREFYSSEDGLENQVKHQEQLIDPDKARTVDLEGLADVKVKIGRFGPYIQVGEVSASLPANLTPADLHPDQIETLLKQKIEGPDQLGSHPETNEPIFVLVGRYGPYVQLGQITDENPTPKRASLPKGLQPENLTVEIAADLLRLPRHLGEHPDSGKKVLANNGRFGPYVVHDQGKIKDYRSLKGDDNPYTINLERALELLAQPKVGRSRGGNVLRSLGNHPADDEPVELYEGRYGPYVKHGSINASVPKEMDIEKLTLEAVLPLLQERESTQTTKKKSSATTKATKSSKTSKATKVTKTIDSASKTTKATKTASRSKATAKPTDPSNETTKTKTAPRSKAGAKAK